ncbi:hypothetical protein BpHYR1_029861, partial [Brachionus plicatilis]
LLLSFLYLEKTTEHDFSTDIFIANLFSLAQINYRKIVILLNNQDVDSFFSYLKNQWMTEYTIGWYEGYAEELLMLQTNSNWTETQIIIDIL